MTLSVFGELSVDLWAPGAPEAPGSARGCEHAPRAPVRPMQRSANLTSSILCSSVMHFPRLQQTRVAGTLMPESAKWLERELHRGWVNGKGRRGKLGRGSHAMAPPVSEVSVGGGGGEEKDPNPNPKSAESWGVAGGEGRGRCCGSESATSPSTRGGHLCCSIDHDVLAMNQCVTLLSAFFTSFKPSTVVHVYNPSILGRGRRIIRLSPA